jgi:hypothetical protein
VQDKLQIKTAFMRKLKADSMLRSFLFRIFLSFHGLSENVKTKIVLPIILYWCGTLSYLRKTTVNENIWT